MAALRTRDGAFLLGEMGPHTMNAGKIYFAAGTPDRRDIFGEKVDLAASVAREMTEGPAFRRMRRRRRRNGASSSRA